MRKWIPLLGLLALCLLPRTAHATYCGNTITWPIAASGTAPFSSNLVSTNNFACVVLAGSTGQQLWPDPAALKDATTNPTTILLGAMLLGFNGTTWDRLLDDANKILEVDCANCGLADEATYTAGTTVGSPIMGFYQTSATGNPCTAGQTCGLASTINRALQTSLYSPTGVAAGTETTPVITSSDPCTSAVKLQADFESTSSGASIVALASSTKIYVCSLQILTSAAAAVSLIEGTGSSVCTGGTPAGVWGNTGVTAANGMQFAANGGISVGDGGHTVAYTQTTAYNLCVLFATTNSPQVNVHVSYVQQ